MKSTVPETIEELLVDYQSELMRAERWKSLYQESVDAHERTQEELRRANNRISLLEKELEELANEGS